MTPLEQICVLIVLLAVGGFSGWVLYHAQRIRRQADQRYYWSEEWQQAEAESLRELERENARTYADPWDVIQALGENWNWPIAPPSQEIYDQFNPRPWARRDR